LDLSANKDLNMLHCSVNHLTSLDLSANTALDALYCSYNDLTAIDLSANPNLLSLDCAFNQLTALDLPANTKLTFLKCNNNRLKMLDISSNTELNGFDCSHNELTELDVSANTALTWIDCRFNYITSLDLSHNHALEHLYCSDNALANLNLKNGNKFSFQQLKANNNTTLTCIEVDDSGYSSSMWKSDLDDAVSFSESCTVGLNKNLLQAQILIYPNPASGTFKITGLPSEPLNLDIYNMLGEKVYSTISSHETQKVDLSKSAKGLYMVNITDGKNGFTKKVEIR
jgi:hypothetical protein